MGDKTYQFPRTDIVLLDVRWTTIEHLVELLLNRLLERLGKRANIEMVELGLEEGRGQGVWLSRRL